MRPGAIRGTQGRVTQAEKDLTRARDYFASVGSANGSAWAQTWLARLHCESEDYQRAYRDALRALELAQDTGSALLAGTALLVLADAELCCGKYEEAERHIQLAEPLTAKRDFELHVAFARILVARLHTLRSDYQAAAHLAHEALVLARQCNYRVCEPTALHALAEAYQRNGWTTRAAETRREALVLCRDMRLAHEERRLRRLLTENERVASGSVHHPGRRAEEGQKAPHRD